LLKFRDSADWQGDTEKLLLLTETKMRSLVVTHMTTYEKEAARLTQEIEELRCLFLYS
jgi:hypothetical protein